MSDSDSSEDETNAQLLAAVDTSFLNNTMYQPASKSDASKNHAEETKAIPVSKATEESVPKSNRFLPEEESIFHSDLNVPAAVQRHTAHKISKLLESVLEFEDRSACEPPIEAKEKLNQPQKSKVRLLASFDEFIDLNTDTPEPMGATSKPAPIRRRKISDDLDSPTLQEKIRSSICDPNSFAEEVQQWKGPRQRSTVFHYKKKKNGSCEENSKMHQDEFTKMRNKNRWDESMIRKFKKQGKTAIKT
ncbi:uncharacterized protein LOC128721341 [Anopheles nili]|uniref:uncharacterized protein LOC128721341 n=1 Tax=Anopheles nili TaxID=185578 RepID=UPI00237A29F1|nr:uncharacterized protein LOC128721341 [Anopheles nili]